MINYPLVVAMELWNIVHEMIFPGINAVDVGFSNAMCHHPEGNCVV